MVSNLLFSQVRMLQTSSSNVENTQLQFGSSRCEPFFDPSPPWLCFDTYFVNHWARSTNQPLMQQLVFFNFGQELWWYNQL